VTRVAILAAAIFALLVIFSCQQLPRNEEAPLYAFPGPVRNAPKVRMVVRQNAQAVTVAVDGPFKLHDGRGVEIPNTNVRLARAAITFKDRCLTIANWPLRPNDQDLDRLRISPEKPGSLEVEGSLFPGELELIGDKKNSTLHAVVRLDLEEYVCGAVAGEVPVETWHEEALKAQAVASRTYALYYSLRNAEALWDFGMSGREAQQYRPGIFRNPRINLAVNLTAGEVLTWNNMVFPAWFHSSCGGHTADAAEVFTRQKIEALAGVECPWCRRVPDNKYAAWRRDIPFQTIVARIERDAETNLGSPLRPLVRPLIKPGHLRSLEVAATSPDGRITRFLARGPGAPGSAELVANDVRLAIGPSELPSTKCRMTAGTRCHFEGAGWGHGVGLCQWGTQGQALEGRGYQQILATYYPTSRIVKLTYGPPISQRAASPR